jgi:two-component system C4-dicarboxylate transport sensor histidine kinase DctB
MADKRYKRLEIRIETDNGQWRLSVLDSGGGIDETDLAKVFDPFFTTKPVGEGLGLGLAISYGIVHDAGGQLQVENLPGGARFSLTLPRDLEPVC